MANYKVLVDGATIPKDVGTRTGSQVTRKTKEAFIVTRSVVYAKDTVLPASDVSAKVRDLYDASDAHVLTLLLKLP